MLYKISMRNSDGHGHEKNRSMDLENDAEARAFCQRVIREMTDHNSIKYEGWAMDVVSAERVVCTLPFPIRYSPSDLERL
jgi:hypothetical protein